MTPASCSPSSSFGTGGGAALAAAQGQLEALQHAPPPHVLDRLDPAAEGVGDLPVRPARPVGIDLEQDAGQWH